MNENRISPAAMSRPGRAAAGMPRMRAFTLIEVMFAAVIICIITLVALPAYSEHVERARVRQAIADILEMNVVMERYYSDYQGYPVSLADVGYNVKLDPWGRPYSYLNLQIPGNEKDARKNKNLHPLNSDYDLYSVGKDGDTKKPLTAKPSRDDVVRATDGRFIDLATNYEK